MLICINSCALLFGFLLDLLLGDPQGWPHIVRAFGALIAWLEKQLYPMRNKRLGGALLAILTLLICTGIPVALLYGAFRLSVWVYFALETLLVWQLLAVKSLRVESKRVFDALTVSDLPAARKTVSMIVGRDTDALDTQGVTRAAVETIAENASDGVVAPLFYLLLGGAVLGCLYKAANTMDSMIGYQSDRYLDFGRCAARLDDALNFLPSRLCALFMIVSSWLCGFDARNALRIWKRDRRKHASPNSAQTESVMAGALHVRLAGPAIYGGLAHEKPFIGDNLRSIEPEDILHAHQMLYATSILFLLFALVIRGCVYAAL